MKHGWRVGAVALLLIAVASPPSAWAIARFDNTDSQYPFETTVVTANSESVGSFGPGSVIYGFRVVADDAADSCGLYDVATLETAAVTQGIFIDEVSVATDENTVDSDWPRPYVLQTDLTVITNAEACIIYHSPF